MCLFFVPLTWFILNCQSPRHLAYHAYLVHPRCRRSPWTEIAIFESKKRVSIDQFYFIENIHTPVVRGGVRTSVLIAEFSSFFLTPLTARTNFDTGGFAGAGGAIC